MTASRRLSIATRGFRGGVGGSNVFLTFEPELVKLEDPFTVTKEDTVNQIQLPADFIVSLDDLPLTVAQLAAFAVTKEDEFEVNKEE